MVLTLACDIGGRTGIEATLEEARLDSMRTSSLIRSEKTSEGSGIVIVQAGCAGRRVRREGRAETSIGIEAVGELALDVVVSSV